MQLNSLTQIKSNDPKLKIMINEETEREFKEGKKYDVGLSKENMVEFD